jgi:16S rRNA processing protein RimM
VSTTPRDPGEDLPATGPVKIGYIRRAHGIKGAVIVRVLGDEDAQYTTERVLATDREDCPELTVVSARPHRDGLLVEFEQIDDRNRAEELRGTSLLIDAAERRVLDDDEFWPEDLIGAQAVTPDGEVLGRVVGVVASSQDRLVLETPAGEREVPFVAAIVVAVDLEAHRVVIEAPEGLL